MWVNIGIHFIIGGMMDPKDSNLKDAIETGKSLPVKPIDMKYWPTYLSENSKNIIN